jgi:hypothetical protein
LSFPGDQAREAEAAARSRHDGAPHPAGEDHDDALAAVKGSPQVPAGLSRDAGAALVAQAEGEGARECLPCAALSPEPTCVAMYWVSRPTTALVVAKPAPSVSLGSLALAHAG